MLLRSGTRKAIYQWADCLEKAGAIPRNKRGRELGSGKERSTNMKLTSI